MDTQGKNRLLFIACTNIKYSNLVESIHETYPPILTSRRGQTHVQLTFAHYKNQFFNTRVMFRVYLGIKWTENIMLQGIFKPIGS